MMVSTLNSLARRTAALLVMLALSAACFGQNSAAGAWNGVQLPDTFRKFDSVEKNAPRSILLIGEVHNRIKTQQQLADLLEPLYRTHQVDAILIEGSNGPMTGEDLRKKLDPHNAGNAGIKDIAGFWKGQLDFGHIAGYEYVALTQKDVKVFGVEDMEAKAEYTAESDLREEIQGLQRIVELYRHGYALAQQASTAIDPAALHSAGADAEMKNYAAKIDSFASLTNTVQSKLTELLEVTHRQIAIAQKMRQLKELMRGKEGTRVTQAEYNNLLSQAGYHNEQEVHTDIEQLRQNRDWLNAHQEESNKLEEEIDAGERGISDQFGITANALRSAKGAPIPTLQTFQRDELERMRIESLKDELEAPYLVNRDHYMVANTKKFFQANPGIKRVALIVGDFHVKDLTSLFRQEDVNLLAGSISETELTSPEAWENRAYDERSGPAKRVLTSGSNKEQSRLQGQVFKQEMPAVVASVVAAGSRGMIFGSNRVYEVRRSKAIVITPDDTSLRMNWGSYMVGSGRLPDGSGKHYLIFDRRRAKRAAEKATTDKSLFVPVYRTLTADGKGITNIDLPTGAVSLAGFKQRIPSSRTQKVPERIILAVEGDAKPVQNVLAGGGSEPPSWTASRVRMAEPPERRGPQLFFTKNPERGRLHMDILEKRDPLKIGEIATYEFGIPGQESSNPEDLWFTPERGDHARALLIIGDNTREFREKLKKAADDGLLKNKEIALGTCFDAAETDALREILIQGGALTVWTPENRITPDAAKKLQSYMQKLGTDSSGNSPQMLDDYIEHALRSWHSETPDDPDLRDLMNASRWTELRTPLLEVPHEPQQAEAHSSGF